MDVLLGFIGIVPLDLGFETARRRIECYRCEIGAHDPLQRVHHRAGTQPIDRIGPCGPIAQADGVVVPIGETEAHQEAASRFRPERIDQFLSQQAHGGRAEDDHSLLVEPNDALIGPKVEELRQLQTAIVHRLTIYGCGALKSHILPPVTRSNARDTAHITGTNPTISVRISRRPSDAAATTPNANATTTVVRTKTGLIIRTSQANSIAMSSNLPGAVN